MGSTRPFPPVVDPQHEVILCPSARPVPPVPLDLGLSHLHLDSTYLADPSLAPLGVYTSLRLCRRRFQSLKRLRSLHYTLTLTLTLKP